MPFGLTRLTIFSISQKSSSSVAIFFILDLELIKFLFSDELITEINWQKPKNVNAKSYEIRLQAENRASKSFTILGKTSFSMKNTDLLEKMVHLKFSVEVRAKSDFSELLGPWSNPTEFEVFDPSPIEPFETVQVR